MSSQEGVELQLQILPDAVSVFLSISDVMINPLSLSFPYILLKITYQCLCILSFSFLFGSCCFYAIIYTTVYLGGC